jgi:hypothetical protein
MNLTELNAKIREFTKDSHGNTDYYRDNLFVVGEKNTEFCPFGYLSKKVENLKDSSQLLKEGYIYDSLNMYGPEHFHPWFEKQFSRKFSRTFLKNISVLHRPGDKIVFDSIESIHKNFEILRNHRVILNGKNIPVQLGEWYAKNIFGLRQVKSASQRGFDFYLGEKRVEIKVAWSDLPSPKGVKIRKSMVDLSEHCIIIYLNLSFMIREICFLDSSFIARKFSGKGHTIFLKDSDLSGYFFSKSSHHSKKVININSMMRYATPQLAIKLDDFH